jgi:hypothetical protein
MHIYCRRRAGKIVTKRSHHSYPCRPYITLDLAVAVLRVFLDLN